MASETYQHLKRIIEARFGIDAVNVGDEVRSARCAVCACSLPEVCTA